MHERMLDKRQKPTWEEFKAHCGDCQGLLVDVDDFLTNGLKCEKLLRFPYGNGYGWGMKYFIKSKHICDLFAEVNGFTIMLRLTNAQFERQYHEMSQSTQRLIDKKYPCGGGGWIHYRLTAEENWRDIKMLLQMKTGKRA